MAFSEPYWFGPHWTGDSVAFRLWAPSAKQVRLCLPDHEPDPLVMSAMTESAAPGGETGWFVAHVRGLKPGQPYAFEIDGELTVPDPASRHQQLDVHDPSILPPPSQPETPAAWQGRPWHEAVVYELHVGTFTEAGTFAAVEAKLDELVALGITAIELMPVADFPGQRNWGYDGTLLFAPDNCYGSPEALKHLVETCHRKGLMVLLDVVYNHFGPDGNYLYVYAQSFFNPQHHTPWGNAINLDAPQSTTVRRFFIENALYWLTEFNLDGLRLDAVHSLIDESPNHFLHELSQSVHEKLGGDRYVHLVLENDHNQSSFLTSSQAPSVPAYRAQWNDDFHHCTHCLLTGQSDGYYQDYAEQPLHWLGRCLSEGFAYQGEPSPYRTGRHRGEPSDQLASVAFVNFIQNHDQIGNRAFGERLHELCDSNKLDLATAILLLSPGVPLLFMGQEWRASSPFLFFCDFDDDLAENVRNGRRAEFAHFKEFGEAQDLSEIPDPGAEYTFVRSRLNWSERFQTPHSISWAFHQHLLSQRRHHLWPLLADQPCPQAQYRVQGQSLWVEWRFTEHQRWGCWLNFSQQSVVDSLPSWTRDAELIHYQGEPVRGGCLPPVSGQWYCLDANKESEDG